MKVRSRKIQKNVQRLSTALVGIWIVLFGYASKGFRDIEYIELLIAITTGIIIYLIPISIRKFAYWITERIIKIDLGTHDDLCEPVKKPAKTNTKEVGVPLEQARPRSKKVLGIVAALIVIIILALVALRDTSKDSLQVTKKVPSVKKQFSQKTSLSSFQTKKDDILEVSASPEQKTSLATPQESKPQTLVHPNPKAEIRQLLIDWKTAWHLSAGLKGDIEKYLSFYSENFIVGKFDKNSWRENKTIRNQNKAWIEIIISDIAVDVSNDGNSAEVRFNQQYNSSNYSDISQKTLILVKEDSSWRITAEKGD